MNSKRFFLFILIFLVTFQANSQSSILGKVPNKQKVTVLTLNTALLKACITKLLCFEVGDMKDNKNRAAMIAKAIRNMSPQPDIIAFQESFDRSALHDKLYKEIKDLYPHTFFDDRSMAILGIGVDSGLAVLSKYPINRKLQNDFTCWAGAETFARKGIMGVELSIKGCPLYLFNAHLQAGVNRKFYTQWPAKLFRSRSCEGKDPDSLSSSEIIQMELRQSKKEIDGFVGNNKKAPILFTGDLNISRTRDEGDYNILKQTFPGALDSYYNGSQIIKSSSWEKGKVAETETDRVDYVWLLNPADSITIKSDIINNFDHKMTDHLGILATIEFSCEQ